MSQTTLDGRARIWAGEPARVVGAGVAVAPQTVLTCYHVVEQGPVSVDFPDDPAVSRRTAQIAEMRPDIEGQRGDFAALRLAQPASVRLARLRPSAVDGQRVRIFGFPSAMPEGVWVAATITGGHQPGTGWHQLDRVNGTAAIERGFSGAPVFDREGQVIGAVTARVVLSGQVVAWMVPVSSWPGLLPGTSIPFQPPAPVPSLPVHRTFTQVHALAEALRRLPVMKDHDSRKLVLGSLSFGGSVPRQPTENTEVFALVRTSLEFPDGFAELYAVVAGFDPDARALSRIRELATAAGLLRNGGEPE